MTMNRYQTGQRDLLGRVMEKGYTVDNRLQSYCAYYPIFKYMDFIDKETGERVQGQQFVCKKCSIETGNTQCKHNFGEKNTDKIDRMLDKIMKPKTILRKA